MGPEECTGGQLLSSVGSSRGNTRLKLALQLEDFGHMGLLTRYKLTVSSDILISFRDDLFDKSKKYQFWKIKIDSAQRMTANLLKLRPRSIVSS